MAKHYKICLKFKLPTGGRYNAAGYLYDNELDGIDGDEIVKRTANIVEDQGEWEISQNLNALPAELQQYRYLVTNRRHCDDNEFISCFTWDDKRKKWIQEWVWLYLDNWGDDSLVLCYDA